MGQRSGGSWFEASGADSLLDPFSKKPITKGWWSGVVQGVGPEFKLQYHKKKPPKKTFIFFLEYLICI
jgi:hypothetical protein